MRVKKEYLGAGANQISITMGKTGNCKINVGLVFISCGSTCSRRKGHGSQPDNYNDQDAGGQPSGHGCEDGYRRDAQQQNSKPLQIQTGFYQEEDFKCDGGDGEHDPLLPGDGRV